VIFLNFFIGEIRSGFLQQKLQLAGSDAFGARSGTEYVKHKIGGAFI